MSETIAHSKIEPRSTFNTQPRTEPDLILDTKQVLEVSSVQSLLILATCPEYDLQVQAFKELMIFTETSQLSKQLFLDAKSLNSIINFFNRTFDDHLKTLCISLLSSVTDGISHSELQRTDLIKVFINGAKSNVIEMQDDAAFGLGNMANNSINKVEIKRFEGIDALTNCLNQNDPDVLLNSLRALDQLFTDCMNKIEFRRIQGINKIINLINSDYEEICLVAANCILKLVEDDGTLVELKKLKFLPMIMNVFVSCTNDSILKVTIQTLAKILKNHDMLNEFPYYFPADAIIESLSKEQLKIDILQLIIAASEKKENRLLFIESDIVKKIILLLGSNDSNLSSHAIRILCYMVEEEQIAAELSNSVNQEILGKLLRSDQLSIKRAILLLVNALILKEEAKSNPKGIPDLNISLQSLVQSDDYETSTNAAECIFRLCKDAHLRSEFIRAGLISSLTNVIEKSSLMATSATLSLSICLHDEEARLILSKSNSRIVERLVSNLNSPLEDLSRNSIIALGNACKSDFLCKLSFQCNVVDNLLLVVNDTTKKISQLAKSTLLKIIEHDPTAKFWLTNKLSDHNKIEDGFVDVGFAGEYYHSIHRLPKREDLMCKQRRTFFLVDFNLDTRLSSLIYKLSEQITNKTALEQIQCIASIVIATMGGIKPVESIDKEVSVHLLDFKNKEKSAILNLGSLQLGSFYHRALLFKTLCDRLGVGPCQLTRLRKMAWITVDKSSICSITQTINSDSKSLPKILPDANEYYEHAGAYDDSNNQLVVDLMFKPANLLYGNEALRYIKYYE